VTLVQFIGFETQSTRIGDAFLQEMGANLGRQTSKKKSSEDESWFVILGKQGKHPVHEVRRLLIPG